MLHPVLHYHSHRPWAGGSCQHRISHPYVCICSLLSLRAYMVIFGSHGINGALLAAIVPQNVLSNTGNHAQRTACITSSLVFIGVFIIQITSLDTQYMYAQL